jgi:hypothetical protein
MPNLYGHYVSTGPWKRRDATADGGASKTDWVGLWQAHSDALAALQVELARLKALQETDQWKQREALQLARVTNAIAKQVGEGRAIVASRGDVADMPDEELRAEMRERLDKLCDERIAEMPIGELHRRLQERVANEQESAEGGGGSEHH